MAPPRSSPLPTATPSELDDLIYFSRAGDLEELTSLLLSLCGSHAIAPSTLLASAIDIDADGLGSQSSLLHFAAANGHLDVVKYLLELVVLPGEENVVDKSAPSLVDHRNINGNTPLHWAAMNGHLEVVKVLVAAGADPGIRNAAGRDAVVEAEGGGREGGEDVAVWLLRNCPGLESGVGGSEIDVVGEAEVEGVAEEEVHGGELSEDTNGKTLKDEVAAAAQDKPTSDSHPPTNG